MLFGVVTSLLCKMEIGCSLKSCREGKLDSLCEEVGVCEKVKTVYIAGLVRTWQCLRLFCRAGRWISWLIVTDSLLKGFVCASCMECWQRSSDLVGSRAFPPRTSNPVGDTDWTQYQTLLPNSQNWGRGSQRRFLTQTQVEGSEQGLGELVSWGLKVSKSK